MAVVKSWANNVLLNSIYLLAVFILTIFKIPLAKPVTYQFYPRDAGNVCQVPYETNGLGAGADSLILEIFEDGTGSQRLSTAISSAGYTFSTEIPAGLKEYKFVLSSKSGANVTQIESVDSVVCGDAYIVTGQSNGVARRCNSNRNEWIRSFGQPGYGGDKSLVRDTTWGLAVSAGQELNEFYQLNAGCWGFEIARNIIENHKVPVAIINGSIGGTSVTQHLRNDTNPEDSTTHYGQLLWRMKTSGLDQRVKAILWHQGENDQPAGQASQYIDPFNQVAAAWKEDYPNHQKIYMFQIRPSCYHYDNMGGAMEGQRQLSLLPEIEIMSTFGVEIETKDFDGCHFTNDAYVKLGQWMYPQLAKDFYGVTYLAPITPPSIIEAGFTNSLKNEIVLKFDQNVIWEDSTEPGKSAWMDDLISKAGIQYLKDYIFLDTAGEQVQSVQVTGSMVQLQLKVNSTAQTISYLRYARYNNNRCCGERYSYPLIRGANGIPALTFYDIPLKDSVTAVPVSYYQKKSIQTAEEGWIYNIQGERLQKVNLTDLKYSLPNPIPHGLYFIVTRDGVKKLRIEVQNQP